METFAIGAISGMSGVLLSHPIDTIKTNIQKNGGILNKSEINGFFKLYRGILSPLLGVGFEKSIVFGTYTHMKSYWIQRTIRKEGYDFISNHYKIPTYQIAISGGIAGLTASIVVSPYERIKILLQSGQKVTKKCFQIRSLFSGLGMTFTREVPGFMIYFSTYENLKYYNFTSQNKAIDPGHAFIYGGMSGALAWIFIYPQDRIKTMIQANLNSGGKNQINISGLWKQISQNGITGLYRGFSFALARGILLHSGTFATMEYLSMLFYAHLIVDSDNSL